MSIKSLLDPHYIAAGGYVLMFFIIYAETGLLIGLFCPGDSLLVTAGVLAAAENSPLNILVLIPLLCVAAILGNNTGYWFGRKTGERLYARGDGRFFKRKHVEKTHAFYEKHGPKTIILARFTPIVRTFAPIIAGVGEMPYRKFEIYDITGGILWISSMTLLGYSLSRTFPNIAKSIDKVVIVIVILSVLPMVIHAIAERRHKSREGRSGAVSDAVPAE